jgi:hypothetical protein
MLLLEMHGGGTRVLGDCCFAETCGMSKWQHGTMLLGFAVLQLVIRCVNRMPMLGLVTWSWLVVLLLHVKVCLASRFGQPCKQQHHCH